jgi:predicted AAA+ superfamily ATPase
MGDRNRRGSRRFARNDVVLHRDAPPEDRTVSAAQSGRVLLAARNELTIRFTDGSKQTVALGQPADNIARIEFGSTGGGIAYLEISVLCVEISRYYTGMVIRCRDVEMVRGLLVRHPVVGILGARQVGKTTLARQVADAVAAPATRFDLEDPRDQARLTDPMLALEGLRGLVVLDEVQLYPSLFPILRVLADRPGRPASFLVLGSASPELLQQSSETLAGRIVYHELTGFHMDEVGADHLDRLWLRGGLPRSFLASSEPESLEWREAFVRTFLERDMAQLGFRMPALTLRRFWTMLSHCHGQIWNASELARSFGVSDTTVRRYLDALASALVVRLLPPWHQNLTKRQVRSPKVYVADSGLLHTLLGIENADQLLAHPKAGASWEGFAIAEILRRLGVAPDRCWFWATHASAELDLMVKHGSRRLGFEIKRTSAPKVTPSMRIAMNDLRLDELIVVHAGRDTFPLSPGIRAVPLARIWDELR